MATSKPTAKKANSELKRKRQSVKRHARNSSIQSRLKTEEKKLRAALETGSEEATLLFKSFTSALDKAAKKGVVHKNAVARKKSRLNTRIAGGVKPAAAAKPKKAAKKAPAKKKAATKKK
jgi:small subunit ribosomal protein S20